MSFLTPPPLRQGDRVAVVAPSGPFDRPSFEKGLELISARYSVVFTERIFDKHRYLAGTDEARLSELQAALDDESIKAIFAARGGYGSARLLADLRFRKPTHLVGFSDFTSIHYAAQRVGWRSLHAPVLTQLGKQSPEVIDRLFALLEGRAVGPLKGSRTINAGVAEGPLLGGNLSVFTRLIGTKFWNDLRGAVLLIEDVGEKPYRLDRMWTHLQLAGLFEGVKGVVFGEFTGCDEKDYSSGDVLDELARKLGVPCAAGFLIGHGEVNETVQLGAPVRLDASAQTLSFL